MDAPTFTITARIRRLSSTGEQLYVQFVRAELEERRITDHTPATLSIDGSVTVSGVVRTKGSTPWLAPSGRWSNQVITDTLRAHGFEHGRNATATIELAGTAAIADATVTPTRTAAPAANVPEPVPPTSTKRAEPKPGTHRSLASEILRLADTRIRLWRWDDYILGKTATLEHDVMTARQAARWEKARWSAGRFPVIQLAVADAVFSKQRKYRTAVRSCVRPFALAWGETPFAEFCELPWITVFTGVFGRAPLQPDAPSHQHLTPEGRVRTILAACKSLRALGLTSATDARDAVQHPVNCQRIEAALLRTDGISDALTANVCMNLGQLQVKFDSHVRKVIASTAGIPLEAPTAAFQPHLAAAASATGLHPFEVDQIIWYAVAEPA